MKKILAMLLVVMMLATLLVSCKKNEEPGEGGEGGDVTTPASTDPNRIPPEIKDFGGYEFKFMTDLQCDLELQVPEEIGSDGINKVLVERNKTVEKLYNVKITERRNVNASADASFSFLDSMDRSEEYFADLYSQYALKMIQSHSVAGFYLDLCELDSIRLDQAWWDQDFNSEFMINDHLYVMTGDIQINDDLHEIFTSMNLSLYNETYPEKNFYQIVVKDGTWTFDEFYQTWYGFGSSDGGATGKVDSEDKVGYYYDCRTANYMYMASDLKAFTIENNKPVLTITSDKALRVMDNLKKITDSQANLKAVQIDKKETGGGYEAGNNHFAAGKALFISNNFTDVLGYQMEMEDTVVYPPFPKYDAGQSRYYSLVHMCFEPLAISANVEDAERTALITEALAFYSDKLEYEVMRVLLKERLTTELETREILQLLLDSKVYELEYTANIMNWTSVTNKLFTEGQLDGYKSEMDTLSRLAVNGRGTGTLELFLTSYAGLKFKK